MSAQAAAVSEIDLLGFVDNQLTPQRRAEVETHLANVEIDHARVRAWQAQNAALLSAFNYIAREPVPVSLSLNVSVAGRYVAAPAHIHSLRLADKSGGLSEAAPPILARTHPRPGSNLIAFILGLAVAFALAGAAIFVSGKMSEAGPTGFKTTALFRLAQNALDTHAAFAADKQFNLEMTAAKLVQLQRFLGERTGFAIALPNLTAQGLILAGGRVVAGASSPAAFLVYKTTTGERVSLTIARNIVSESGRQAFEEAEGASAMAFCAHDTCFALVTPGSFEKANNLAKSILEQLQLQK